MEVELYYEQGLSQETERFQEFCNILEYRSAEDFTDKRALFLSHKGLGLITPGFKKPLYIKGNKKAEKPFISNLVRACIPKEKRFSKSYSILDAFSGFGSDAMILALTNNPVTTLEKDPLVWLMLREQVLGLANVDTICHDCLVFMQEQSKSWDTIYLDPMFYQAKKKALPSLELQHLRVLFSDVQVDIPEVLEVARRNARERVVVKRKTKDPQIATPNFSIKGKLVRFDVYIGEAA